MKIILFTDLLGAGGAQRQLVGLAVMLKEYGYNVKVCTYFRDDFFKPYLDSYNVDSEVISGADNKRKRVVKLFNFLKNENPDWVIAYQETPSLISCIIKILGGKFKLIVSERNTTQLINWSVKLRFFLYHWADAIVPNSFTQESLMIKQCPWMKDKIFTITNFVDLDSFYFVEHIRHNVLEIVVAASIKSSKNTLGLIEAAKILKERQVQFHIRWYGKVEAHQNYLDLCNSKIEQYGLRDYFSLLSKTKEIANKYREADYFCLPSFFEGTPNVICEAASSGLPILCSNVCDNSYYVQEGINGILFNPDNPLDIANKIEMFLKQDLKDYKKACMYSRKIAEEKMSKDVFLSKYLRIINK